MTPLKTAILLVNLGSPDAPTAEAVRSYLAEFLSDKRVIDLPRWLWYPILYGIILRVRPPKKADAYQAIWTDEGSPLIAITKKQADKLSVRFANEAIDVFWAMRYGQPSIGSVLDEIINGGYQRLLVFPLYPQYARATTETVRDKVSAELGNRQHQLAIDYIDYYYDDPQYIEALADSIRDFQQQYDETPDKLIFSYHGMPKRYIKKGEVYDQHCLSTTQATAQALGLNENQYLTTFQSRFGFDEWLQPYTDETLKKIATDDVKIVHILSPAFAADCLETLEELEVENREYFETADGQDPDNQAGRIYRYIPALNDTQRHIDVFESLIRRRLDAGYSDLKST